MKLLRLTTNKSDCVFNETLNEDLILQPNSKIALKNISIQSNKSKIQITGVNDTIRYKLKGNNDASLVVCHLSHRNYPDPHGNDILEDITLALNKQVYKDGTGKEVGSQWNASIENGKQTQIEYRQSPVKDISDSVYAEKYGISSNINRNNTGVYSVTDNNKGFVYNRYDVCRGFGIFRMKINSMSTDITGGELVFGFLNKNPATAIVESENNFLYFAKIKNTSTPIQLNSNGTLTGNPIANYTLEWSVQHNLVIIKLYNALGNELDRKQYIMQEDELYPYILWKASAETKPTIKLVKFCGNPFHMDPYTASVTDENQLGVIPSQDTKASKMFLQIDSIELATFLGYTTNRFPDNGGILIKSNWVIPSTSSYLKYSLADSFIVEMLNLSLDSYDTSQNQRKNILATIPQDDDDEKVLYNEPYPIFIDLRNNKKITLRNIQLRILREDYSPLEIQGQATMTLLLD